jgi:5-methyltetrahydrofolate--homocysteine methyltransferase
MTIAEAASAWLSERLKNETGGVKVTKPAAGYASCPDHTLKGDILKLLGALKGAHKHDLNHNHEHNHDYDHGHGDGCTCGCGGHEHHHEGHNGHGCCMGIELTESYAMAPDASICGLIFMHPQASYPEVRSISRKQYDAYAERRGMDHETARRFLGHLLK